MAAGLFVFGKEILFVALEEFDLDELR